MKELSELSFIKLRIKNLERDRKHLSDYLDRYIYFHTARFIIDQFAAIDKRLEELNSQINFKQS